MTDERSRLPVLLTELTIMLLVFALCAAVCLSIFATARKTARESAELGQASLLAQSAAEIYKSTGGSVHMTAKALDATELSGMYGFTLCLDENWVKCESNEDAAYRLLVVDIASGAAEIRVTRENEENELIFTITAKAVKAHG